MRTETATRDAAIAAPAHVACRAQRGPGVEAGGVAVEHGKALDMRSQPAKRRFYQRRHAANLALSRSIVLIARQSTRPRYSSFV